MALTLAEANKLSNDQLIAGIQQAVLNEDPVLFGMLRWQEVIGTATTWNRRNASSTVAEFDVGDTWTEGVGTVTQLTRALTINGGDADVDNFLRASRRDTNDLAAQVLEDKAQALAYHVLDRMYYGSGAGTPTQMHGLHKIISDIGATRQIHQGSGGTGAALSVQNIDALLDLFRPKPDILIMPRLLRRMLRTWARSVGGIFFNTVDLAGMPVEAWNGVPLAVSDGLGTVETIASSIFSAKTGGATMSIIGLKLLGPTGLMMDYTGVPPTAGSTIAAPTIQTAHGDNVLPPIQIERIGSLETKDATRWRVKAYCNLREPSVLTVGRIDGISNSAAVIA